MDELDLVRTFREHQPPPDEAARARARRAWQGPSPPRRPLRAGRRVALVAAGTALTAGLAVLALDSDGGDLGAPDARAAQTLERAAVAAQADPLARPLRPGEFWYVRKRTASEMTTSETTAAKSPGSPKSPPTPQQPALTAQAPPYTYVVPSVREDWTAADGSGRFRVRPVGAPRFAGPRDRARWDAAGRPELVGDRFDERKAPAPVQLGNLSISYGDLLALPTDPRRLHARLRAAAAEGGGSSVEDETFTIIGDVLRDTAVPSLLRAGFFRAAALIPGVRFLERERDLLGRPGVGVAFDDQGRRDVLIFDRETYALLGEQTRLLKANDYEDAPAGRVVGGAAVVSTGIVGSDDATPTPGGDRRGRGSR